VLIALVGWWLPLPSLALAAQQRVVLLCHLDSPRIASAHWRTYGRWWLLAVPFGLLMLLVCIGLRLLMPAITPILVLPALILAASGLLIWQRERRGIWTAGAVDAAALASVLAVVHELPPADYTELWVVALGSGAAAGAGLQALLDAYPFPPTETWFINLPWLGRGTLTTVVGEGLWRERQPDVHLSQLFHELQSATAPLGSRRYRDERLDSARLLAQGYRAISVVGLNADGSAAGFRHADDSSANLDPAHLATAITIIQRALLRLVEQKNA